MKCLIVFVLCFVAAMASIPDGYANGRYAFYGRYNGKCVDLGELEGAEEVIQAEEAHNNRATVVALATSCRAPVGRPYERIFYSIFWVSL